MRPPSKASCFINTPSEKTRLLQDKAAAQSWLLSMQRGHRVSTRAKAALGTAHSCQQALLALPGLFVGE